MSVVGNPTRNDRFRKARSPSDATPTTRAADSAPRPGQDVVAQPMGGASMSTTAAEISSPMDIVRR